MTAPTNPDIDEHCIYTACKAVYGNAESDNVAQRTVDAIRKLKF